MMIRFLILLSEQILITSVCFVSLFASETVQLRRVNETFESTDLKSLFDEKGILRIKRLSDVKTIVFESGFENRLDLGTLVELTNGDLLFVNEIITIDDAFAATFFKQEFRIPIEVVKEITWETYLNNVQEIITQNPEDDQIRLENGDVVAGEFITLSPEQLDFVSELGLTKIPSKNLRHLRLSDQLSESISHPQTAFECYLSDGSVLTCDSVKYLGSTNQLRLTRTGLFGLNVSIDAFTRIEIWSERFRNVLPSQIIDFAGEDFFGNENSFGVNQSSHGGRLLTAELFSKKGFGVRSRSTLSLELPPEAISFNGSVGLDIDTMGDGNVSMKILINGKREWEREIKGLEFATFHLPLDLSHGTGATLPPAMSKPYQIDLVVEFGPVADIGDFVNWQQLFYVISR